MAKELKYWSDFVPGTKMTIMKFTIIHCCLYLPGMKPERCASDDSSKKYGFKIFDQEKLLVSGAGDFGDQIIKRLSELGFNLDIDWTKTAIDKQEFLAFLLMVDNLPRNSYYLAMIDNQIVAAFNKTRSNIIFTNKL